MSLSGSLQDVSLADVLQFIHLGHRTGTLTVERGDERASIGFHQGRIVGASSPAAMRLGDLLLARRLIDEETLSRALALQRREQPPRSLGRILLSLGAVSVDAMQQVIEQQITESVSELISWQEGSFHFELDDLEPVDQVALFPRDLLPEMDLDTETLLMEASRIFDEKQRNQVGAGEGDDTADALFEADEEAEPAPIATAKGSGPENRGDPGGARESEDLRAALVEGSETLEPPPPEAGPRLPHLQVVSSDQRLVSELRRLLGGQVTVEGLSLASAGRKLPTETPPIVLVDLRDGYLGVEQLASLREGRPRASVVAVLDESMAAADVFEAGAIAGLPAEAETLAACYRSIVENRQALGTGEAASGSGKSGFARLRRVVSELRSGLISATMALNLMKIISESVERAILFLVKDDALVALGAFGFSTEGRPLAEAVHRLRLPLTEEAGAFREAVSGGEAVTTVFDEPGQLPPWFQELIGKPASGQVVLFPVIGTQRAISVIYADNGPLERPIEEIEILELATAQVGIAFENELLRRQLTRG